MKKLNILFVPFEKENYVSDQTLLGLHGNYMIEYIEPEKINKEIEKPNNELPEKIVTFNTNETFIPQTNNNINNQDCYTDVLDMIPDIIHLTEDDSNITTDTEQLISHNFK
jgi:hypothetical protein